MVSTGIETRFRGCSSGINMEEKGLGMSRPCSAIARLMIALMVMKVLFTERTDKSFAIIAARTLPASMVVYSEMGLSPITLITSPTLRIAAG